MPLLGAHAKSAAVSPRFVVVSMSTPSFLTVPNDRWLNIRSAPPHLQSARSTIIVAASRDQEHLLGIS
jgi:hypothetical protein